MKRNDLIRKTLNYLYLLGLMLGIVSCGYLQVNPPPDVKAPENPEDKTAWLAAASNMLAAAGYGYGYDLQIRAENIYQDMLDHFGTTSEGWTDAAIQWWIGSDHNEWPENTYRQVRVMGNKAPITPWANPEGAMIISHLLREGTLVAASISWPDPDKSMAATGGHVLNCWGDDQGEKKGASIFPSHLRVTDCYRNKGGIIQTYKYDDFQKKLPDGSVQPGWYLSYDENQPFIKNIVLLSESDRTVQGSQPFTSRIMVDIKNHMSNRAGLLELDFILDKPACSYQSQIILDYKTKVDGKDNTLDGMVNKWRSTWNFNRNSMVSEASLTAVIESSGDLDSWSGIYRGGLSEAKGEDKIMIPGISFKLETVPLGSRYSSANASGGYFIFLLSFIKIENNLDTVPLEILLLKQYPATINPERPSLQLTSSDSLILKSLKAGHSYGYLSPEEQMDFTSWMVNQHSEHMFSGDTLSIPVNLIGLLPFPRGENYGKRAPEQGRRR